MPISMDTVPSDVLLEIASYLPLPAELLHLGLTSARIFQNVSPALYADVTLRGSDQCLRTLNMLCEHPNRARHVRVLCVMPDDAGEGLLRRPVWGRDVLQNEYAVSALIRRVASHMEVLRRFEWDAEELPPYDDMWFALRVFCPQLKYVGATLGSILTSPNSHLFDFSNLHGFSLTFRSGFYSQYDGVSREEAIPGYQRLWEMLIKRCPNLQELTIDGYSPSEPVDAHRLTRGRWPALRKLVLGDIVTDWHTSINQAAKRSFITFLDEHPSLEILHLQGRQPSVGAPSILQEVLKESLSKVKEFGGSLEQLAAMQHKNAIQKVCIPDAIVLRESTPLSVSGVLSSFTSLTSLTIAFTLLHGYDNGGIIRSIVMACPRLEHLDFTCSCKPSFTFETFCRSIRPLGKLRTLTLRVVKSRSEDDFATCGARLAWANPRLSRFTIEFLERGNSAVVRERARFELDIDQYGLPLSLRVYERWRSRLPWRGNSIAARCSVVDLRPVGYPGTRQEGLGGLLALATDRTPAGQEMRLLCFCLVLLVSAIAAYFVLQPVPPGRSVSLLAGAS